MSRDSIFLPTSCTDTTAPYPQNTGTTAGTKRMQDVILYDASGNPTGLSSLVPFSYDQITITAKNGNGDPTTVLYKKSSVTIATLTLTYDIDGDLSDVTRS